MMQQFFHESFAPLLVNRLFRVVSFSVFFVYVALSFYGCCSLQVNVSPTKMLSDDSRLSDYYTIAGATI